VQVQESGSPGSATLMRSHPRLSRLIAVVGGAAVVFLGINVLHTFGPTHLHNDGPLVLSGAGFAFASSTPGPYTGGYVLCLQQGTDPAIIESISPASTVGIGLNYLGAFVRDLPADTGDGIGTSEGFPPKVAEKLLPVACYRVTHQCSWLGGQSPNSTPPASAELDVGIGRRSQLTGGGWTGYTVAYVVDSTQYVATWDNGIYACGQDAPASGCLPPI
jgi:hypothetical protein